MSYYTGRGDYYSGKGDPGLLSVVGKVAGVVSKLPGPLGFVGSTVQKLTGSSSSKSTQLTIPGRVPAIPTPGLGGYVQRAIPGGQSGYMGASCTAGYHLDKTTRSKCVRNRSMNYTNPRALARSAKRLDGFVGVARKALKSTNYKVVTKSYKQGYRKPAKR